MAVHDFQAFNWEEKQSKREAKLDLVLFWASWVTSFILFLLVLDVTAGILYYFQESIDGRYKEGMTSIQVNADYLNAWYMYIMIIGAQKLTVRYPWSIDGWREVQKRLAKKNYYFELISGILILAVAFIFHWKRVPPGYTDPVVLCIYHVIVPVMVLLAVIANRTILYFVNQRKYYDYQGVPHWNLNVFLVAAFFVLVLWHRLTSYILPHYLC